MPAEVMLYFLKHKDDRVRLLFQVIFQCAPFLKGLKISAGIMVDKSLYCGLDSVLRETGITYKKLMEAEGKALVLLYREKELGEYLSRVGIRSFLHHYGYEKMGFMEKLDRLSVRAAGYAKKQMGFPHEIGIFLGYPIEDVRGFIKNEGKNCLLSGYWKVYSDPVRAEIIFHRFDEARDCAVNEFLTGMNLARIAENRW